MCFGRSQRDNPSVHVSSTDSGSNTKINNFHYHFNISQKFKVPLKIALEYYIFFKYSIINNKTYTVQYL